MNKKYYSTKLSKENPMETNKIGSFGQWLISTFSLFPVWGSKEDLYSPNLPKIDTGEIGDLKLTLKALNWDIWHLYPNISEFKITLRDFNPLLFCFGMLTRYKPILHYKEGFNEAGIDYLLRVQVRLAKLKERKQYDKYWSLVQLIVSKSDTYLLCCMHKVDKNLYRKLTISEMKELIRNLNVIRGKFSGTLDCRIVFNRAYVPKGEKWRPLGVPTLAWRIYLNMLLNPLVSFTNRNISDSQHGFRPQLGTFTAWKTLLKTVLKALFVFEIDLKQCFPSISLPSLEHTLTAIHNLPPNVAKFYTSLNYMVPMLPEVLKLDEAQMLNLKCRISQYSQEEINQFFSVWNLFSLDIKFKAGVPKFGFLPALTEEVRNKLLSVDPKTVLTIPSNPITRFEISKQFKQIPDIVAQDPIMSDEMLRTFESSIEYLHKYWRVLDDSTYKVIHSSLKALIGHPAFTLKTMQIIKDPWTVPGEGNKFPPSSFNDYLALSLPSLGHQLKNVTSDPLIGPQVDILKLIGVAQGANTSPYLSILQIDKMVKNLPTFVKVLIYADDMIFYSSDPRFLFFITEQLPNFLAAFGLLYHPQKSGFVKCGIWLKKLKFLGLEYDGEDDSLRAHTRNGSTLIYNKQELLEYEYSRDTSMEWVFSDTFRKQLIELNSKVTKPQFRMFLITPEEIDQQPYHMRQAYFGYAKRVASKLAEKKTASEWFFSKLNEDHGYWRWMFGRLQSEFRESVWFWDVYKFIIVFIRLYKYQTISFIIKGLMKFRDKEGLRKWLQDNYTYEGNPKTIDPTVLEAHIQYVHNKAWYMDLESLREMPLWRRSLFMDHNQSLRHLVWELFTQKFPEISGLIPRDFTTFAQYIIYNAAILHSFFSELSPKSIELHSLDLMKILKRIYPLYVKFWQEPLLNPIESSNGYLKRYRSKFTWQNFINSNLSGMILARLYTGDYLLSNLEQNFKYESKEGSLAELMKSDPDFEDRFFKPHSDLTIFTGTSYSIPYLYDLLAKVGKGPPRKKGYYEVDPPLPPKDEV